MAGKAGGAWKVAYADFVTAMMAFFLVMWITAQSDAVKEAVAKYFKDPFGIAANGAGGLTPGLPMADTDAKRTKEYLTGTRGPGRGTGEFEPDPSPRDDEDKQSKKPTVLVMHDGDQSSLGTILLFSEGSAELDELGRRLLDELVPTLRGKANKVEIRGHASARPLEPGSPFETAWELCYARCVATMRYLEERGIEPRRMRLCQAGPYEPHSIRVEPRWQAKNSRVEVKMLGEFVDDFVGTKEEREGRFRMPKGKGSEREAGESH
jgi:chemotaxis protein MotB